jgi:hypothetical protein
MLYFLYFTGEIHSAVELVARPEGDGATRRGLLVLQAHAGQRAPRHTPHGDATRQKANMKVKRKKENKTKIEKNVLNIFNCQKSSN